MELKKYSVLVIDPWLSKLYGDPSIFDAIAKAPIGYYWSRCIDKGEEFAIEMPESYNVMEYVKSVLKKATVNPATNPLEQLSIDMSEQRISMAVIFVYEKESGNTCSSSNKNDNGKDVLALLVKKNAGREIINGNNKYGLYDIQIKKTKLDEEAQAFRCLDVIGNSLKNGSAELSPSRVLSVFYGKH